LAEVLHGLPNNVDANLLVGINQADDAGVYKINDRQALVQTVDFFPPIVDDPFWFGQIAASNALSDIYAMGARPLTALNIVGFPPKMPQQVLQDILRGGQEKIAEAGAVIVGGHSIKDNELKYGVACTGIIEIDKIVTNAGAQPGDILILTKPLGTGVITTAIKQKLASPDDVDRVTQIMAKLNKVPSELMVINGATAATDVTGFGLLGHAYEMAAGAKVSIEIEFAALPIIEGAVAFAKAGALTGGANANLDYLKDKVDVSVSLKKEELDILYDAQTSGGLLVAMSVEKAEKYISQCRESGVEATKIGRVIEPERAAITII
jgi:selenide,water dikinase